MSQINTNGIDAEYPVPGQNNSSQGFRDNFTQIKNNLDIAGDEITDLQNTVVVKQALEGVPVNNDMANTLISNAAIQNFRSTVFNLGSALSGTVVVDTSLADTHEGIVSGDISLEFAKWAPDNTERSINLRLTFSDPDAVVSFPSEVISFDNNYGTTLLENYRSVNDVATITKPATSDTVELTLTTLDCGETITVTPLNRPFRSTQIVERDPTPMGLPGDVNGTIAIGSPKRQIEISETANLSVEITANSVSLANSFIDGNILTVGTVLSGDIQVGMLLSGTNVAANTYIANNDSGSGDGSTWVVNEAMANTGIVSITGNTGIAGSNLYVGVETTGEVVPGMILTGGNIAANTRVVELLESGVWSVNIDQFADPATINGNIDVLICDSTEGLTVETPVNFTGNTFGNIDVNKTYYVDSVPSETEFTLSSSPGGNMFTLTDATGTMFANPAAYLYLCVDDFQGEFDTKTVSSTSSEGNIISVSNTNNVDINTPIFFTGNLDGTNIVPRQVYYVKTKDIPNGGDITISPTRFNGVAGSTLNIETVSPINGVTMSFINGGKDIWRRIPLMTDSGQDPSTSAFDLTVGNLLSVPGAPNLKIGGGTNGQYLQTDGNGNLTWVSGGGSGNGVVGGSNTQIQFNDEGAFGGSPSLTFDGLALNVTGNANISGNISVQNISAVSVTSTDLTGTLLTNAQPNITSVGTLDQLTVSGNISANNLGNISAIDLDGNVSNVLRGDGTFAAQDTGVYGNANVASLLGSFGSNAINTTGLITANAISATGNITSSATIDANIMNTNLLDVNGNISALNIVAIAGNITATDIISGTGDITTITSDSITSEGIIANTNFQVPNVIAIENYIQVSASANLEATGNVPGDALALTSHINEINTVAIANASGVALPKALAGMRVIIRNSASSNVIVYTNPDDGPSNTSITLGNLTPNASVEFFTATGTANSAGTWYPI